MQDRDTVTTDHEQEVIIFYSP